MCRGSSCRNYGQHGHQYLRYNPQYGSLKHLQNHRSTRQRQCWLGSSLPPQPQKSMPEKVSLSMIDPAPTLGPQEHPERGFDSWRSLEISSGNVNRITTSGQHLISVPDPFDPGHIAPVRHI
jgi:hypothetical protein